MIRGTTTLVEAEQVAPQRDASPGSQGHFNTTPPRAMAVGSSWSLFEDAAVGANNAPLERMAVGRMPSVEAAVHPPVVGSAVPKAAGGTLLTSEGVSPSSSAGPSSSSSAYSSNSWGCA